MKPFLQPWLDQLRKVGLAALLLFGALACSDSSNSVSAGLPGIKLPPGFHIEVFADDVPGARSLALSATGTLFVSSRGEGRVYAVVDTNSDFKADRIYILAEDLFMPNGIALRDGSLYVAEVNRVIRFDNIESNLASPPQPIVVSTAFPSDASHGWKFIRFGPDGKLYIPVGAPCNVCTREDQRYATIMRMNPDGSALEVYARGIRNSVGFDWHPTTGELWFTDNGRDMLGDDIPPDELNHAPQAGLHFGFPYCHGGTILDPEFGSGKNCLMYTPPARPLGPHVAALGMRFYTGTMFPAEYRHQIFIAEHGSWNRSKPIGYRVSLVRIEDNKAISYETFADGWRAGGEVSGRPVDLEQLPDGSLLLSDDYAGKIYRIHYRP